MIRQRHLIAVVGAFLIAGVVVGCAGVRSEASQEEQGRTETTKQEQGPTVAAKDQYGSEEARCSQTRTFKDMWTGWLMTTNDIPGCPNGGLLSGTDERDKLDGKKGDDEIHGLGDRDDLSGGMGSDVIYGGPGKDFVSGGTTGSTPDSPVDRSHDVLYGEEGNDHIGGDDGEDVLCGGDGNDTLVAATHNDDDGADKLYCGAGIDHYYADKLDYVDSSCEKKEKPVRAVVGRA